MRRRDTRCKQWKRVHDVPLSSLAVSRLRFSFIISLFIFCSALLFPFLLFSLSLVNIYMCIRIYTRFIYLSFSPFAPYSVVFLFLFVLLSVFVSLAIAHVREIQPR